MKAFQDHHGETGETMNVRGAHFLKGDISAFDAGFFGLNQLEVKAMDPQHRLLLEIAFESFENAGMSMESLWGSNTGVIWRRGLGPAISSNRISYFYNLHGPIFTVDTGCSSSLVALHQAIHSLRSGEASQCFVGGVNLLLDPQRFVYQSKLSLLSSEGRSFAFDSRAAGYGRGEGCTGVVIKPLSAAIRDDDSIRAVIRNTSVTQDGRTPGIAVPSASAQVDAIARAYRPILGDPEADYIEAHGTGTQAFGPRKLSTEALPIGSVKANIGHTEAAAGLASLIKSVLMLEHGMIPPQANFITPNPKLLLDEWKIRIPTKLETRDYGGYL
ncbi:polyketide synthase [Diaporthe sp. PMI_573]|nr:polyketide synthase [Diaporthaceae sp. PMI_573]